MAEELAPGKYDLNSSENFDEYMKAAGVGTAMRLIGNLSRPRQEIQIVNGIWTVTTSTPFKKVEIKFKIGEQFEETTADGRKVLTTCMIDGNRLVQNQKGKVDSTIIRDFSKDSFVMTLSAKGVVSKRYYTRVE